MAVYAAVRLATEVIGAPIERVVMYGRSIGTGPIAAASDQTTLHAPPVAPTSADDPSQHARPSRNASKRPPGRSRGLSQHVAGPPQD